MLRPSVLIALIAATTPASAGLAAPAPALASPAQVITDCSSKAHLTRNYSRSDLQRALNGMGADVREYTNCYDVVRGALLSGTAGGGQSGGGNSGGPGATGSANGVSLGGSTVRPGGPGADSSSGVSLPAPLIGVLGVLGLAALGGGGLALRRRVIARHGG